VTGCGYISVKEAVGTGLVTDARDCIQSSVS
jgi:hypothetical protein